MTNAVGYTRLSDDGLSIPDQKEKIRGYCDREGFDLERIYDDGKRASGYGVEDRPDYRELRQRVKDGDVDAVVVRDTGRIGRDFDERMYFVLDCRQAGIELHSTESGQHDLSDPYSVVIETAQAAGDDVQKRHEIERAKEATRKRIENGCYHGKPPLGLRFADDDCHLEKHSEEFEQLEEILDRRENGDRVVDVAEDIGVSTATVSRVANRGLEWYDEKLAEYGLEETGSKAENPG